MTSTQGVVTGAVVSGPVENTTANIWNGAASGPLFQQAQILENGQAFDNFVRLSQPLGSTLSSVTGKVMPGDHFTFDLTTAASGTFHYTVKVDSLAFTTEALNFIDVQPSGPLSSVVGNTVTYSFTLPKTFTYTAGSVFLFAHIFDGPPNNPAAHSCSIGADGPLTLNFGPGTTYTGSGSITFPANMSACGLNPSVPIAVVDVFLQVEGSLGEDSIVQWRYPY